MNRLMIFKIFIVLFVNTIQNFNMSRITLIKTLGCWLQIIRVHQEVVLCKILTAKCEKDVVRCSNLPNKN